MTAVRDGAGRGVYRAVQVVDLTERRRQEEVQRDSALSRDVLDRLLEGCQVVGFDWRYLYVNDLLVAQARRPREEFLGRTMMECYPGIEQTPMFARLQRAMRDRVVEQMENDFAHPDGARVVYDLRFVPAPQGVCVLSLDITERRHRLAAIVHDSDDAIIGRTLDGAVTSWNRSAERMFGYAADEMIGRDVGALLPAHLKGSEAALAARLVEGERVDHFETVRQTKDGRLLDVSVTLSPGLLGLMLDNLLGNAWKFTSKRAGGARVEFGVEALDYLFARGAYAGRAPGQPQIILLDLKLPRIDGLEVLRAVRLDERTKLLPVVILTSSVEEQDLIRGYGLGANSYVRKPVDFLQFAEAVRQLGLYWLVLNESPPLGRKP